MTSDDSVIRWNLDGSALYSFRRTAVPASVERVDVASGRRETVATLGDRERAGLVSILGVSIADDMRTLAYATWRFTSVLYTLSTAHPDSR